jgi:two-component system, cell cycle response regulator
MHDDHWGGEHPDPLILIAEDDPLRLQSLGNLLKRGDYPVITAMNGRRTMEKLADREPDLLLIDGELDGTDDPDLLNRLKSLSETRGVPMLVVKRSVPTGDFFERFSGETIDFISEPVSAQDLLKRVSLHLAVRSLRIQLAEYKEQLDLETESRLNLSRENAALRKEVNRKEETIRKMRVTDPLTGLYNYRYIMDHLSKKIAESRRYDAPLAIVLLCIDHFKAINAQHGLDTGDEILIGAAGVVKGLLRDSDIISRYSGDEFLILLPHTDADGGYRTAERIRGSVEALPWDEPLNLVTVSGGVTALPGKSDADPNEQSGHLLYRLIMAADSLLFKAKSGGGNRVEKS